MADVYLKPKRDKAIRNRHPWVFSGAVDRVEGEVQDGDVVAVRDNRGAYLASGYINRQSQIVVRLLAWDADEQVDERFWRRRLAASLARRRALATDKTTNAYRVVHAEADQLPGLIVDRYGDFLIVQCLTLGVDARRRAIVDALAHEAQSAGLVVRGIYERSDVEVRAQEGLDPVTGPLYGEEPPPDLEILEHDHRFGVDLATGQKTGFYLDQRENRATLARYVHTACDPGATLLDAFAYSGGFSVYAARAGVGPITLLDVSADALARARRNLARNAARDRIERTEDSYEQGDVFAMLRLYRDQGRSYDVIVLDPPKFAPTRRHVDRAARAYKDVNLWALKLLRPGGLLFTFSCSGGVDAGLFQKIVFGAALDAGRQVQIVQRMTQGPDHPVLLSFPESAYLKGLVCRAL
jgi:23S rRNA (cytosine1962-C5)-methyltransferase